MRTIKCLVAMSATLCCAAPSFSSVTVTVDPGLNWIGYMNVFQLPVGSGAYVFGSPWGAADLQAVFDGPQLVLSPNTNTYNPGDAFWVNPDGTGAKWMNANMYVEDPTLVGQTVEFVGYTLSNTFVDGYSTHAFIKVLDPGAGWATIAEVSVPLVHGQPFALNLDVPNIPGLVPQYGFATDGANANPATVHQLGQVVVVPEPAALVLLLSVATLVRRRQ